MKSAARPMIQKMLDLSTAHMSKSLIEHLKSGSPAPFRYLCYDFGYVLWVTHPVSGPFGDDEEEGAFWDEYPELAAIMEAASAEDCYLIKFDTDADKDPFFPSFS